MITTHSDSDGGSAFLDEIDRIAQTNYEVTDCDIVRARLKTVGVQEYKFAPDAGKPLPPFPLLSHRGLLGALADS